MKKALFRFIPKGLRVGCDSLNILKRPAYLPRRRPQPFRVSGKAAKNAAADSEAASKRLMIPPPTALRVPYLLKSADTCG